MIQKGSATVAFVSTIDNRSVSPVDDEARWNAILPIGGPGPAITPREQGERLFALLGRPPKLRSVPVSMLDAVIGALAVGETRVTGLLEGEDVLATAAATWIASRPDTGGTR